jgi:hypothetical protein
MKTRRGCMTGTTTDYANFLKQYTAEQQQVSN